MSETLKEILESNLGFRTETFSGSQVRIAEDVIRFEIGELENPDIIEYMQRKYNILGDYYNTNEDYDEFLDMCFENLPHIADEIMTYVRTYFGCDNNDYLTALWLTTHDNVIKHYKGTPGNIDKYYLPDKYLVISDLGEDGTLFIFNEMIFPIYNE